MNERSRKTHEERMRMLVLAPVIAFTLIVSALLLVSLAQSRADSAAEKQARERAGKPVERPDPVAARREQLMRDYRECLDNMGGRVGRTRLGGRFGAIARAARQSEYERAREAARICRSLLSDGGPAPSTTRKPAAPPIA
jgi:hypothetical protein